MKRSNPRINDITLHDLWQCIKPSPPCHRMLKLIPSSIVRAFFLLFALLTGTSEQAEFYFCTNEAFYTRKLVELFTSFGKSGGFININWNAITIIREANTIIILFIKFLFHSTKQKLNRNCWMLNRISIMQNEINLHLTNFRESFSLMNSNFNLFFQTTPRNFLWSLMKLLKQLSQWTWIKFARIISFYFPSSFDVWKMDLPQYPTHNFGSTEGGKRGINIISIVNQRFSCHFPTFHERKLSGESSNRQGKLVWSLGGWWLGRHPWEK